MKIIVCVLILLFAFVVLRKSMAEDSSPEGQSVHSFTLKNIDGQDQSLADYKGKVILLVNTASHCGFTPQYKGLEALYQQYKDKGFVILGFPANNFMGQEPGSNAEIKKFCELKFKTTFPMFAKIDVAGNNIAPLYAYLTKDSGFPGSITWNFNKFLVGKDGKVIARFGSKTEPQDVEVTAAIEKAL